MRKFKGVGMKELKRLKGMNALIAMITVFLSACAPKTSISGKSMAELQTLKSVDIFKVENPNSTGGPSSEPVPSGASTPNPTESGEPAVSSATDQGNVHSAPLMVDFEAGLANASFELSSPAGGVKFDILGDGVSRQISWPVHPGRVRFLVLPNASGQITSVQQLFSDRTVGPDGKGATNGFEALRKYDLNRDGVINGKDEVYSKLRLWADLNRDGKVDKGELISLAKAGIGGISLEWVQKQEIDSYGNQTLQRSSLDMGEVRGGASVTETTQSVSRMIADIVFHPAEIL